MTDTACYSDEFLTLGIRDGDEGCFTTVYKRYWKPLFYQAESILGDELLAQDCVQEVFVSLWKRRKEVKIDHLFAYLKASVRFKAVTLIRSQNIRNNYLERLAQITSDLMYHQPLLFKEMEMQLHEALYTMPADQQEIFRLIREEGCSYKEVAELKGISIKTVEKKMSLSLKSLRLKLGEFLQVLFLF